MERSGGQVDKFIQCAVVGLISSALSACKLCGSPTLLAFGEGSWQGRQEMVLRCGQTTPAVGFAILKCELGQGNSSFLRSLPLPLPCLFRLKDGGKQEPRLQ